MYDSQIHTKHLHRRIREYLAQHPDAADTLEGIAAWWLSAGEGTAGELEVRAAVEQMQRYGEIVRRTLPDGTAVFAARGPGRETID